MKAAAKKNFHLPLSPELHARLHREAKRLRRPATDIAREAIADALHRVRKQALHEAIAAYAADRAGSDQDLDELLESSGVELLRRTP
jgi:predicted transcriptional regulator